MNTIADLCDAILNAWALVVAIAYLVALVVS